MKRTTEINWISDRYPDERLGEFDEMLITTADGLVKIASWDGFYWEYDGHSHLAESVKAWAPCPTPYREVQA